MFRQLSLKCFRQHRDLTLDLTDGVIAIRGRNEIGKSTLYEAIAYAFFGATALREPLSETVTWGEKETALKTRVDFTLSGVDYRVTRSKSGAEIRTEEKVEATGQAEVTKFIETLLGASKDVCRNLMMADQTALRGALAKGPSAAIELIEKLANFSLIDTILSLVQDKLPCGTTSSVEARIGMLEGQAKEPVEDHTGPLEEAVEIAEGEVAHGQNQYVEAKADYDAIQAPARNAEQRIKAHQDAQVALNQAKTRLEVARETYERIVPQPGPTETEVTALRKEVADVGQLTRAAVALRELRVLPEPENEWEGDHNSLALEKEAVDRKYAALALAISNAKVDIARREAMRITQTACGLCGKDLTDVPEVAEKNAALDREIAALREILTDNEAAISEEAGMRASLDGIMTAARNRLQTYQRHAEFILLDHGYVPARWTWTGPDTSGNVPPSTAGARLAEAEAQVRRYQQALGQKDQARYAVDQAEVALGQAGDELEAATHAAADQQEVLEDSANRTARLNEVQERLRGAQEALKSARQALEAGKAVVRERQRARAALQAQLDAAKAELVEMQDNNALVQAIRKARPQITDELWDVASGSISHHFSAIRGTPSEVTRADNGFKVDGQSIGGLSGSTLDALGLAIRVALTKVFLPNTSFMMLDEPAAAADEQRESNMLGLIATCGFDQVILITHSDLSDSFASQVVQL